MSKPTPASGSSPTGDERLADWLDGRMTPRELERFEAEMRVSKPLREKAEAYKKTAQSVKDAFSVAGPKVDVASKVLARLADPHGNRPGSTGGSGGAAAPLAGGVADAAPAGRVLAFPKSLPKPFLLSSLVACAMIALVLGLQQWQPTTTTESALVEGLDAGAHTPAPAAPVGGGEKAELGVAGTSGERAADADAGERQIPSPKSEASEPLRSEEISPQNREAIRRLEEENRIVGSEAESADLSFRDASKPQTDAVRPVDPGSADPRRATSGGAGAAPQPDDTTGGLAKEVPQPATFGMPLPMQSATPRTAVPTVRLRLAGDASRSTLRGADGAAGEGGTEAKAKGSFDREQASPKAGGNSNLLAGALQLDRALGNVQVFRLPAVPGEAGAANEAKDKAASAAGTTTPQAWIVEGPAADVQAFLTSLSDAGRARGYEIVNGEVGIAELQALDPSLPAVPGARFVPRPSAGAANEPAPGAGGPSTAGPSSPGPGGPVAPAGGRRGNPTPPGAGGGGGAMLVMPVRVVVVIESAK